MNVKELYVLNRALDGENVTFLPTYESLGISGIMIDVIKDGMIEKGLLASYDEFSEYGLKFAEHLRRYKEAKKHIKLNNLAIGVESETQSILISFNSLLEEYFIDVINSAMSAEQIAEYYSFLIEDITDITEPSVSLPYNELTEKFPLHSGTCFKLSFQVENSILEEIYLKADNKLYIYDCVTQILHPMSRQDIMNTLYERMNVS